jgi:hypothetical protein
MFHAQKAAGLAGRFCRPLKKPAASYLLLMKMGHFSMPLVNTC